MRVAACQMNARQDKAANLAVAVTLLEQAARAGADLAVLPEYLDYLGTDEGGVDVAEPIPGPVSDGSRPLHAGLASGFSPDRSTQGGKVMDAAPTPAC